MAEQDPPKEEKDKEQGNGVADRTRKLLLMGLAKKRTATVPVGDITRWTKVPPTDLIAAKRLAENLDNSDIKVLEENPRDLGLLLASKRLGIKYHEIKERNADVGAILVSRYLGTKTIHDPDLNIKGIEHYRLANKRLTRLKLLSGALVLAIGGAFAIDWRTNPEKYQQIGQEYSQLATELLKDRLHKLKEAPDLGGTALAPANPKQFEETNPAPAVNPAAQKVIPEQDAPAQNAVPEKKPEIKEMILTLDDLLKKERLTAPAGATVNVTIDEKLLKENYVELKSDAAAEKEYKKVLVMPETGDGPEAKAVLVKKVVALKALSEKYPGTKAAFYADSKAANIHYLNAELLKENEASKDFAAVLKKYANAAMLTTDVVTTVVNSKFRLECAKNDCRKQSPRVAAAATARWMEEVAKETAETNVSAELYYLLGMIYNGRTDVQSVYEEDSMNIIALDPMLVSEEPGTATSVSYFKKSSATGGRERLSRNLAEIGRIDSPQWPAEVYLQAAIELSESKKEPWIAEAAYNLAMVYKANKAYDKAADTLDIAQSNSRFKQTAESEKKAVKKLKEEALERWKEEVRKMPHSH